MPDILDVEGLEELADFIDHFVSVEYIEGARRAMTNALLYLHSKLPGYPSSPAKGEASKHWTDKQRRWFFWALKAGEIEVPYKRTGTLGRRFTTRVKVDGPDISGVIGTDVPYTPWVVGPDESAAITFGGVKMYQAPIHRGRWWQFIDVVERNLGKASEEFVETFFKYMEKEYKE